MEEIWKYIPGYDGSYKVSNMGGACSCDRIVKNGNSLLHLKGKPIGHIGNHGYYILTLSKNGIKRVVLVHRVIASLFVPNPDNKPMIDHIDGCRTNNKATNLRWCTNRENLTFPIATENRIICQKSKRVAQIDKNTGEVINVYLSAREIKRKYGFNESNIWKCCHCIKPSMYGYKWKYITEDEYRTYKRKLHPANILAP